MLGEFDLKQYLKRLMPLTFYIGLIIGAAVFCLKTSTLPYYFNNLIMVFSYSMLVIVITISFTFNRSRVFFIGISLIASQLLILSCYNNSVGNKYVNDAVIALIYIILPLNILLIASAKDGGILSVTGRRQILLYIIEFLFLGWIVISHKPGFVKLLLSIPINIGGLRAVPLIPFLFFNMAFIYFIYKIFTIGSAKNRFFFAILLSVYIGLFSINTKIYLPIFTSVAAIFLLLSALQDTYYLAYIDELTGLPGRRALREKLAKLRGKYSIIMIDIDFFKKFNDTYGHDSGDEILKFIGKALKEISGNGKGYRYGGEEFAIVYQGKGVKDALPLVEELRAKIEKSKIPIHRGTKKATVKKVSITISCGIAEKSEKYPRANEVIKAADSALYRAKGNGRNCVCK